VVIAKDTAANAPDQRAMPAHQSCQRSFIALIDEAPQELPIGQACPIVEEHGPAQVLDDVVNASGRHRISFRAGFIGLYLSIARTTAF
jgi:hypothetical protein